jgi:uncharacterized protein (DUF433 family)
MSANSEYVRDDGSGALRVGKTRVMLDSVLAAWSQGDSPETIQASYPSLTLEEVYGAITWILSHRDQVEQYLKQQDAVWEHWRKRSEANPSPMWERLRAAAASTVKT